MKTDDLCILANVTKKARRFLSNIKKEAISEKVFNILHVAKQKYPWCYIFVDIDKDEEGEFVVICIQAASNYATNNLLVNQVKMETLKWKDKDIKIMPIIETENMECPYVV